ncbi:hypothetical protein EVAR_66463_1 [Eumeta japonica]|uniref:DUF4780 domain-containing protein n=1 Tax=Eumeta variegata TaxID=151549 RepID=A0A4C1SIY0_EUMVA|nr:hypothetical protein EVAR_66463_1 [Eumeta japonica]
MDSEHNLQDCTPSKVHIEAISGLEKLSLVEGASGSTTSHITQMDCDRVAVGASGPTDTAGDVEASLSQLSVGGASISSAQERLLLLESVQDCTPLWRRLQLGKAVQQGETVGAGRRRLKALIARGIPLETARSLAQKPSSGTGTGQKTPKRSRSDSRTPTSDAKPTKRFETAGSLASGTGAMAPNSLQVMSAGGASLEVGKECGGAVVTDPAREAAAQGTSQVPSPNPTLAETVVAKKVGITPHNFPEVIWTSEEIKAVQKCILDRVYEARLGPVKPRFAGCSFKPGWLTINCLDDATVSWLRESVPALKPWEGAVLRVLDEADVPKAKILIGYFSGSTSWTNDRILGQIEAQNSGIRLKVADP